MDATLTFTVDGPPVPQPRPRISTWGGRGRAYTPTDHEIHPFRQAVAIRATLAAKSARWARWDGPVVFDVVFVFGRPASHMNASGGLRAGARAFPPKCDWDNLGKGVSDAITTSGAVWKDDEQIVDGRVRKRYAEPGERPGTIVTIRQVTP